MHTPGTTLTLANLDSFADPLLINQAEVIFLLARVDYQRRLQDPDDKALHSASDMHIRSGPVT
jgi:hypothetical protein